MRLRRAEAAEFCGWRCRFGAVLQPAWRAVRGVVTRGLDGLRSLGGGGPEAKMKDDAHRAGGRRYAPSWISLHVQLTGVNAVNTGLPDMSHGASAHLTPGLVRALRGLDR